MTTLFSTFDMSKILEIKRGRFLAWYKSGFITATYPSPGQGIAASFSMKDLYKIELFKKMIEFVRRKEAAQYLELIGEREFTYDILYLFRLDGKHLINNQMPEEYDSPLVTCINFKKIRSEVNFKVDGFLE